jgi:hypothetical protein
MSTLLSYIVAESVATLKINRPAKRNVMTFILLSDFISMLTAAGEDPAGVPGFFAQESTCQPFQLFQANSQVYEASRKKKT